MADLFAVEENRVEPLGEGAARLRGFAESVGATLFDDVQRVIALAPLRRMVTPGGLQMSVAMTNCGALGWVSDRSGYRYDPLDPRSGNPWPAMPVAFTRLAHDAAAAAGFAGFAPDACLVNCYEAGTRLSLHQDRDEHDYAHPIVSVSLGVGAVFQFGGLKRSDRPLRVRLEHGDVVVWGGPSRLRHHGVLPLEQDMHPLTGARRFNLTFRKAG